MANLEEQHTLPSFSTKAMLVLPRKIFYLANFPLTSSSDTVYIALRLALLGNKIGHRWSRFANGFRLFLTFQVDPCVRLSQLDLRKRIFFKNEQYCQYDSHATLQYNHIAPGSGSHRLVLSPCKKNLTSQTSRRDEWAIESHGCYNMTWPSEDRVVSSNSA